VSNKDTALMRDFGGRIKQIHALKALDQAHRHLRVDAVAHGKRGIFFLNDDSEGSLCAVIEVAGITTDGLTPQNLEANQRRIATIMEAFSREVPELSLHTWQDASPVHLDPRLADWRVPFLQVLEHEQNERRAKVVSWEVKNYIALEFKANFAYGGTVPLPKKLKAGVNAARAKSQGKTRDFEKHWYIFKSIWSPASRRKRIFGAMLEASIQSFSSLVDRFAAEISSPVTGFGAYRELGSLTYQVGAQDKVILKARRLNAEEGYKALYCLGDPQPDRRHAAKLFSSFNLSAQLGMQTVDFSWLFGLVTGQDYSIKDADLRALGEHGPYTVGGIPRQIFAVRTLPERLKGQDLFAGLRARGVPYTARVRWAGLSETGTREAIKKLLAIKRGEGGEGFVRAEILGERVTEGIAKGMGGLGMGSILIAVNGVPRQDADGRLMTGAEVLHNGIRELEKWATDNEVLLDPLIRQQEFAHYAMYPGSAYLDPIERIPIRAFSLAKVLPLYSASPEVPPSTIAENILTYKDRGGQLIERALEVGQVGLAAVCGGTGSGKSYNLCDIITNFNKNEGRLSQDPMATTIDCFEFGSGSDEGSSFNSIVRLLGGKVIQFSERGIGNVNNPFDMEIPEGGNYTPDMIETLNDLLVTMAGGDFNPHKGTGTVTPAIRQEYKEALLRMGGSRQSQIPGHIRSLSNLHSMLPGGEARRLLADWADPRGKGLYFPSAPDETRDRVVNYNFSLNMPTEIRAVQFAAVTSRLAARVFSPLAKHKLLIGDELGQGLAPGKNDREEAIVESARILVQKVFTNARRFGGRCVVAFQNPQQILSMGSTLSTVIKSQASGYWLYPMANFEQARELFNISEEVFKVIQTMPRFHCALIQGGLLTVCALDKEPGGLGHAAITTDPAETALRDAMVASGRYGDRLNLDITRLINDFSGHLRSVRAFSAKEKVQRLRELTASYPVIAA
jgi:hypothetical protein